MTTLLNRGTFLESDEARTFRRYAINSASSHSLFLHSIYNEMYPTLKFSLKSPVYNEPSRIMG